MINSEVYKSFERLNDCGTKFYDDFYEQFINASPEFKAMFAHTNMDKQKSMLLQSLTHAVMFAFSGNDTPPDILKQLVKVHQNLAIKAEYFDLWRDTLVACIDKHDPQFNQDLKKQWLTVLNKLIKLFKTT